MFGENPSPESYLSWVHYVLFTLVINIVLLNLLISIIGDTYGRTKETMDAHMWIGSIEMLLEVHRFFFWKDKKKEKVYLHYFEYTDDGNEDEWEAKMNKLTDLVETQKED